MTVNHGSHTAGPPFDDSSTLLQQVLDASPSPIFVKDAAGRFLVANEALARSMNLSVEQILNQPNAAVHPVPEEVARYAEVDQAVITERHTIVVEEPFTRPDGSVAWYQTVKAPLVRPDGSVNVLGIATDITALREALDEIRRLNERLEARDAARTVELARSVSLLEATLDSTADGILVVDQHGRVSGFNRQFLALWRIPETLARAGDDERLLAFVLNQVRDPEGFLARVRELYRNPEEVSFDLIEFLDGRVFERYSQPQRLDGIVVGRVWSFRDVTDRRRAEEAARESQELFEMFMRMSPAVAFVKDAGGRYVYVNRAFEEQIWGGTPPPGWIGRTDAELWPDAGTTAELREHDRMVLETGRQLVTEEAVPSPRGERRWLSVRFPLRRPGGEVYVAGMALDVSDRLHLEEQLRQAAKMEAIGRLAGGVAHDFNNLLTGILGYCELVLDRLDDTSTLRSDVEEIQKAAHRAAALTRQLLAFGRKQVLQPRVLDLNTVVRNLDSLLRRVIGEDVSLTVSLDPALGAIRADPGQLEQVILNLAVNAREAMPAGGHLRVATGASRWPGTDPPRPAAALIVADSGLGMDEETRLRVFEPFFTTKAGGTGLGLSTVYGIVKQSGGEVEVQSDPGSGTTFTVLFPVVSDSPDAGDPVAAPVERTGRLETILVVEDEQPVRSLARRILERGGYRVLEAGDAAEALAVLERHPGSIELLLSDLILPGTSGTVLAERVRRNRPGIRTLFMSGYPSSVTDSHGTTPIPSDFLQKPFTPTALLARVRDALAATTGG